MHPSELLALMTAAAVGHYDALRIDNTERTARLCAENYLRRKVTGMSALEAAETLAEALAVRASFAPVKFNRIGDWHK